MESVGAPVLEVAHGGRGIGYLASLYAPHNNGIDCSSNGDTVTVRKLVNSSDGVRIYFPENPRENWEVNLPIALSGRAGRRSCSRR